MKKYFLIGIKGAGMSALASILTDIGHQVYGSDIEDMLFTQVELEAKGIAMNSFGTNVIESDMEVIVGNAFSDDHDDVVYARQVGAKVIRYHDFLGELTSGYTSVAISGTHGKTTTSGMLAHVMRLNYKTSYLIGDGTGKGVKDSPYFVYEACEYKRHFLAYHPDYAIITNIEHDHPDYFKDEDDVIDAFVSFASQCKKKVIACGDDKNVREKLEMSNLVTYGFEDGNNFIAKNILKDSDGTTFDVIIDGIFYYTFKTPFFGDHMILNSLAVIAVCYFEGLDAKFIAKDLSLFDGVKRRFSITLQGSQIIIDDYAHHPTEIEVTLRAVRQKYPGKELVAIFQPHTVTRTKAFVNEFKDTLKLADHVYLTEIFGSARENSNMEDINILVDSDETFELITTESVSELKQYENGVLVFMGAGDIEKYENAYLRI